MARPGRPSHSLPAQNTTEIHYAASPNHRLLIWHRTISSPKEGEQTRTGQQGVLQNTSDQIFILPNLSRSPLLPVFCATELRFHPVAGSVRRAGDPQHLPTDPPGASGRINQCTAKTLVRNKNTFLKPFKELRKNLKPCFLFGV